MKLFCVVLTVSCYFSRRLLTCDHSRANCIRSINHREPIQDSRSPLVHMAPKKKDDKKEEDQAGREDVGVFTFHDGAKYDGQVVRKDATVVKRHGNGVFVDVGDATYDGQWAEDEAHGEGVMTFESGAVYSGAFFGNLFDGKGIYTWPDGSSYDGYWRGNKMHGEGIYTDLNGDRWYGKFYDGIGKELLKEV